MTITSPNKDVTELMRQARKQGWAVDHSGRNHLIWTPPGGNKDRVYSSLTPSCVFVVKKIKHDLIRRGFRP